MTTNAFFRGRIVPLQDAKVSIRTHSFNYGTGVFGGIRAYWNPEHEQLYLFRLRDHYHRFLASCRMLLIDLPYSIEELSEITTSLLRSEAYREDCYCRPLAYKSDEKIGARLHGLANDFAMYCEPLGRFFQAEEELRVMVSSWHRIDDNAIPPRGKIIGAYVNSALAKSEAVLAGFDDAVMLTNDGYVSEGCAANLFVFRDGRLITPEVTAKILEGITRRTVIEVARSVLNIPVEERLVSRSELYDAEELFFCGTGVQIAAIVSVDQRSVGSGRMGPLVHELRQIYFQMVRGNDHVYGRRWCTPVYPEH